MNDATGTCISNRPNRPGRKFISGLVLCMFVWIVASSHSTPATGWAPQVPQLLESVSENSAALNTQWRYTRYGWQKPSDWNRSPSQTTSRSIDQINPGLLAIEILLAVAGVMIWSSDECQVAKLLGRRRVCS